MTRYEERIQQFLEELKKSGIRKIIAFSGSVPNKDLEQRAEKIVEESFDVLNGLPIAIQTGGTEFDIQKYAAERAKKQGMPLIGIYPSRGEKYRLDNLDFALEVEPRYGDSEWGDDTEIFAKLPDGVEMIAGGTGTLIELGHIMAINKSTISHPEKGKKLIYLAPVRLAERRTTADIAYELSLQQQFQTFMPDYAIFNGRFAAEFLVKKLNLS